MPMTPEVRAATEKLEEAIKGMYHACATQPGSLLIDWIVVMEGMAYDDEGDRFTVMDMAFPNGQCRTTSAIGMLTLAHDKIVESPEVEE